MNDVMKTGEPLFKEVAQLTGLPEKQISQELEGILQKIGVAPQSMTVEDLRKALAIYLLDVFDPLSATEHN